MREISHGNKHINIVKLFHKKMLHTTVISNRKQTESRGLLRGAEGQWGGDTHNDAGRIQQAHIQEDW